MNADQTFRHLSALLRPFRWRLLGIVALTGVLSVLAMLPPLLTREVINGVIGAGQRDRLPMLGALLLLCAVLNTGCGYFQAVGMAFVGQSFVMRVRTSVYRHLLNLSMDFFGKHNTGMLVNRLMGDSTTLQQMLSVASVQIVSDLVCATFAVIATLFINWRLALPLLGLVFIFALNYRLSIERIRRTTRSHREAEDRVASGVQNRLFANLTVRTFGAETREHGEFTTQSSDSLGMMRESQVATGNFSLNTMLLQNIGRVVIFFLGCAMVLNDTASYGDVVAFTAYAMQLLWPAVRFSQLAQQLQNVGISAERLFELLDESPRITDKPDAQRVRVLSGRVDFNKVEFAYEPDRPVLTGIDFHTAPGETTALVGPTGCGKTTVLSLLMRLFDVQGGSICVDGIDVRDIALKDLRRQFGIVLQESLLFTVSIADNIRFGRYNATRDEVVQAARIAEIHEDIIDMPGGYDACVGSRDVQLSVGQKQRISIARAVLADPAILIMDEATSALDSESERAIQLAMGRFLHKRSAFIVAHRLSTIRNAHRIILLDNGNIVEMGNHAELMAISNGRYRDLYNRHAGRGVISEED